MAEPKKTKHSKKPYEKPQIAKVPLRPEEAVLGACKTTSGVGPFAICGSTCPDAGT
ncbi:MAG: hypothetical protein N3D11_03480 [Candidatus Sumerlaeia bacterium]|nr:hypothetical protein [Candidatus Sumerlaeia bacterium]